MDFEPLNEDHSIEEVVFACHLSRRLRAVDFRQAVAAFGEVRSELPAVNLDDESAMFAYLRPDGSATWAVSFHEGAISVSCTRYSRWEKVWSTALAYLMMGLGAVAEPDKLNLIALVLSVSDKFRGQPGTNPPVGGLLQSNNYLMPAALSIDGLWHSHVGWFDAENAMGPTLNQLNIDRITEGAGDLRTPALVIRHVQQLRFDPLPLVTSLSKENEASLETGMEYMHARNKKILGDLLASEMRARISLVSPQ